MPSYLVRRAEQPVGQVTTVTARSYLDAAKRICDHAGEPTVSRYFNQDKVVIFGGYKRADGSNVNPVTVFVRRQKEDTP